jgi:SAM-dependent methyltransferase
MPEPDRTRARELAARSRLSGDPTGWFETLYREQEDGKQVVPWADCGANPNLPPLEGAGKRALIVGCGFGDDAEQFASWGFEATAFDVSPAAARACKKRFPDTRVDYQTADLLHPPPKWTGKFDLVVEIYTLQVLPQSLRPQAIRGLAGFAKEDGRVLLIARGRDEDDPEGQMPWPLTRRDLDDFTQLGLQEESFEDFLDRESPPVRRFRAVYLK